MEPALIACLVYIVGIVVTFFVTCFVILPNSPPHYNNVPAVNLTYPFISAFVALFWPIGVPALILVIFDCCRQKQEPPLINQEDNRV